MTWSLSEMCIRDRIDAELVVALRKESVDRNEWIRHKYPGCRLSLSARRAWVEISFTAQTASRPTMSLSARRAWIEIIEMKITTRKATAVALRKESVDRN